MNSEEQNAEIIYQGINSKLDFVCFGFADGFAVYSVDPFNSFRQIIRNRFAKHRLRIVEMTHSTDIIALVGSGVFRKFPLNKVILWNVAKNKVVGELTVPHDIFSVVCSRKKIVVVCVENVYIFSTANLQLSDELTTYKNINGLGVLSSHKTYTVLAIPSTYIGSIRLLITENINTDKKAQQLPTSNDIVISSAHSDPVSQLAINHNGSIVASTSDLDLCIRLWDTRSGNVVRIFQKSPAASRVVTELCFNKSSTVLATVYQCGAIDIFLLEETSQLRRPVVERDCLSPLSDINTYDNILCGMLLSPDDHAEKPFATIRDSRKISLQNKDEQPRITKMMCTFVSRGSVEFLIVFCPGNQVAEYEFRHGGRLSAANVKSIVIDTQCPAKSGDAPDMEPDQPLSPSEVRPARESSVRNVSEVPVPQSPVFADTPPASPPLQHDGNPHFQETATEHEASEQNESVAGHKGINKDTTPLNAVYTDNVILQMPPNRQQSIASRPPPSPSAKVTYAPPLPRPSEVASFETNGNPAPLLSSRESGSRSSSRTFE